MTKSSHLEETELELAKELAAVDEVARIVTNTLDIDDVYSEFATEVKKLVDFDRISIGLVDLKNGVFTIKHTAGQKVPGRAIGDTVPLEGNRSHVDFDEKNTLIISDTADGKHTTDQQFLNAGLRSVILVPLTYQQRVIGGIQLSVKHIGAYGPKHRIILERLAAQIAPAIVNSELYQQSMRSEQEEHRLAQESQFMAEIGQVVSSSLEIEEVYGNFAELVRNVLHFDQISINVIDVRSGTTSRIHTTGVDIPDQETGVTVPLAGTFTEQVTQSSRGIIFQPYDLKREASIFPTLSAHFPAGCRSFLGVPLISRGAVFAVLNIFSSVPQAYSTKDLDLAWAIGQQIAGTIANAQLHTDLKRAEEAERRRHDELKVRYTLARILSQPNSLEIKQKEMLEELIRATESEWATLRLLDEEGSGLRLFSTAGTSGWDRPLVQPLHDSLASKATRLSVVTVANDYPSDPSAESSAIAQGARSMMSAPIFTESQVIGAVTVVSRIPNHYTDERVELLPAITDGLGVLLNRAKLTDELRAAEESLRQSEERHRDLYDHTPVMMHSVDRDGHLLSVNNYWLQALGYERSEVVGRKTTDFFTEASRRYATEVVSPKFWRTGISKEIEYQLVKKSGEVIDVLLSASSQRDKSGAVVSSRTFMLDVTERRRAENAVNVSLREKEVLLQEINHRVKNNLQIISGLLSLQSQDIQDEQALRSFQVSQDRIKAMALVHEKLYRSDDLARIDIGDYIRRLAYDLRSSYGLGSNEVQVRIEVHNILLGVDMAIPCGLIVNELVTNSLKHAFPEGRPGEIVISFKEVDGQYILIFKDDGVGLPEDLYMSHPSSLGLTIVNALTRQLNGTIDLVRSGGTEISIAFPVK